MPTSREFIQDEEHPIYNVILFSHHYPNGKQLDQSDLDISPVTSRSYDKAVASMRQSLAAGTHIATKVMEFGHVDSPNWQLFVFDEPGVDLRDYLFAAEKAVRDVGRLDLEKILHRWKTEYQIVRYSFEHFSGEVVYEPKTKVGGIGNVTIVPVSESTNEAGNVTVKYSFAYPETPRFGMGAFYSDTKISHELANEVMSSTFIENDKEIYVKQERDNPFMDGFLDTITTIAKKSQEIFHRPAPKTFYDWKSLIQNKQSVKSHFSYGVIQARL